MRRSCLSLGALVVLCALSSGCALTSLKEANRRLVEANDRLIGENNQLERELASLQQELQLLRAQPAAAPPTKEFADPPNRGQLERDLLLGSLEDVDPGVEVQRTSQGIRVRIPDRIFFALGQAKLSRQGQSVLQRIASLLNSDYGGHLIRVDGHTDDTPIRKVRHIYPTNWELSTARACTVVRYLVDRGGVNARRIFPAGFAYFRPLESGGTKSKNRRVEITILNERV